MKKVDENYYFDSCENFYELIRRKNPRFQIPAQWLQSATIQATVSTATHSTIAQHTETLKGLKSSATIIEMSKAGMKLKVSAEIPRYEKNKIFKLKFKIFRRAEIQVNVMVVHLKKGDSSGQTIGVQFMDETLLLKNKIQNICDDLAFYYAAEA